MIKKGKRVIALFLAVLLLTASNSNLYQVFGMDADQEMADADKATQEKKEGGTLGNLVTTPQPAEDPQGTQTETRKAEPEPQVAPQAPALAKASEPVAVAEVKTFDMENSVTAVDTAGGVNSVYAGSTYYYKIHYTVPPLGGGGNFTNPQITVELPEHVGVLRNAQGELDIVGQDVLSSIVRQNGKYLYITLNSKLDVGTAKDITIGITTTNFKMENGALIKLSPQFTAQADGQKVVGAVPENKMVTVAIKADDGWTVKKSAGQTILHDTSYEVPYTLEVANTQGGVEAVWNRTGRIDMESFLLTDILPTGYPEAGGASSILSVYMGMQELEENTDYTILKNVDGSVKSLQINKINRLTKEQESQFGFVKEGTPIPTTYTIRVAYPRGPYKTPSDAEQAKEYILKNDAVLNYKLLGEQPKEATAFAQIKLGEKEAAGTSQKITVRKLIKLGDREFPVGSAAREYGTAEFALYKDRNGTLANTIDGTAVAGSARETGQDGTVTFSNLRSGTYYLKETRFPDKFQIIGSDEYIPIEVKGGIVSLGESYTGPYQVAIDTANNRVEVKNTTSQLGALEFYKYGTKPDGTNEMLSGVTFQLKGSAEGAKVYSATSDTTGRVTFHAIPVGTYTLTENTVGNNSDYEKSNQSYQITIAAGVVNKPALDGEDSNGNAVFRNVSPKGYLKIKKVNEKLTESDEVVGLSGAKFELYGPYNTASTVVPNGATPVKDGSKTYEMITEVNGEAISIPLKEGHYILKETQAPSGYVIKDENTSVQVVKNKTNEAPVTIENEKQIALTIKKVGVLGSSLYEEQLAGAKFYIYDAAVGGNLLGELTTYLDGTNSSTSNTLPIKAGTYWYEEAVAPEGYAKVEGRTSFRIDKNDPTTWQLRIENTPSYGQLKINKQDSKTRDPISGVVFGIYTDSECKVPYTKGLKAVTMTTDAAGAALSPLLPPLAVGGYYVKEKTSANGYWTSDSIYGPYTIIANKQILVNNAPIGNDKHVSIVIKKTDSVTSTSLNGAQFKLYESETGGTPLSTQTVKDGTCTFSGLKPNTTYWYEESMVPNGYVAQAGRVSVTTSNYAIDGTTKVDVTVTNMRKAKLSILKTTDMDGNGSLIPMAGVKFKIYEVEKGTVFVESTARLFGTTGATDAKGKVDIDGLDLRKDYYAVELLPADAIEGYTPLVIGPIAPSAGMNQGTGYPSPVTSVTNNATKGKIQIEKISSKQTDKGTTTPVQAFFDIYEGRYTSASDLTGKTPVGNLTTSATTGMATSGWLAPGAYTLREASVTGAYTINTQLYNVEVVAAATNTTLTGTGAIENVPKGKIEINKKSTFKVIDPSTSAEKIMEYDLSGMQFDIYKKLTDTAASDMVKGNLVDTTGVSMSSSSWTSKELDAGEYWVKETVPDAHKGQFDALDAFSVTVTPGDTVPAKVDGADQKSVFNASKYGKIRLFKRDIKTNTLLENAEFELYEKVTQAEGGIKIPGAPDEWLKQINASTSSGTSGNKMVSGTNGAGQAVTTAISPGTYYLKETKPPASYSIIDLWTGPVTVTTGQETQIDIFNYKPASQEGTKQDQADGPLQGAFVGVFESQLDAQNMQTWLTGEKVGTGSENYQKIVNNINTLKFRTDHKIVSYGVSGVSGNIKFNPPLVPTKTYYVMELLPPKGYLWNTDIQEKIVKADGTFDQPLVIVNTSGSQMKVWKYTTLSGKDYSVEGVRFDVYQAVEDELGSFTKDNKTYKKGGYKVATGVSDANGAYITIYLPKGTYIIEEYSMNMPPMVAYDEIHSTKYQIVTIAQDGDKRDGTSKPDGTFYNPSKWAKFFVKKVDAKDIATSLEATFGVWKKNDTGKYEAYQIPKGTSGAIEDYVVKTKIDGTYTESIYLEPGAYQLRETSAPSGYTKIADPIDFNIRAGVATYVEAGDVGVNQDTDLTNDVVINWKQGSLAIQKYGYYQEEGSAVREHEEALQGVKFSLYKKQTVSSKTDCIDENRIKKDQSTDHTGIVVMYGVDAGDYWLVETATNNPKYPVGTLAEQINKAISVTITSGAQTPLTNDKKIINNTNYGKIKLKKIDTVNADDGSERPLADAQFTVYTDATCNTPLKVGNVNVVLTTNEQGIATSIPIPAGTYWVKETQAPTGYALDATVKSVVVAECKTTDITATPFKNAKQFKIQMKKLNKTGEVLAGAEFALYTTKKDAQNATSATPGSPLSRGTTNAAGVWETGVLSLSSAPAIYYLKELKAPSGYAMPLGDAAIHEVVVGYADIAVGNVPTLSTLANTTVTNEKLGTLQLQKNGEWQGLTEAEKKTIPLEGVEFTLYPVSGNNVPHDKGATAAATLTTGADGKAQGPDLGLKAGWYEVVERVPNGYVDAGSKWVEIVNEKVNTTLTGANAILNRPNKGNFVLKKYDGNTDSTGTRTGLAGAQFMLYQKDVITGKYKPYQSGTSTDATFTMSAPSYTSGMLEPGSYQIIETKAPNPYKYKVGTTEYTVEFQVDATPIPFVIKDGTTIGVNAYNSPKGSIQLKKTGDAFNQNELINAASFQLLDQDKRPISGTVVSNGQNGLYRWDQVSPGTYYIQELPSQALELEGYVVNPVPVQVIVPDGKLVSQVTTPEDLKVSAAMTDHSNKGRLRIIKQGETAAEKLTGAVFEIYAKANNGTWEKKPIDKVTVDDANNGTLSKLLPADATGTPYLVKEIKAPDGYTLDATLAGYPISQEVRVYPHHTPTAGQNTILVKNKKLGSVAGFESELIKEIRENPSDVTADETDYANTTTASESLLLRDYHVDYRIKGYADEGKNETGAKSFVITDNDLTYWSYDTAQNPTKMPVEDGSFKIHENYQMNSLEILTATNADPNAKAGAKVYVQYTKEQKDKNEWVPLVLGVEFNDLSTDRRIDLTSAAPVIGVKVEYQNVAKGFKAEGLVINATFKNRGEKSAATDHEVREIRNRATLSWEDTRLGADGKLDSNSATVTSASVISYIPTYTTEVPQMSIRNAVVSNKSTYYAGDEVDFRTTATHHKVDDNVPVNFRRAVMSLKLSAFTTLNEQKGVAGFTVYKISNGVRTVVPSRLYDVTRKKATASLNSQDPSGDTTGVIGDFKADLYTFEFQEDSTTTLAEGEEMVIEYSGFVSYDRTKAVGKLVSPAYLSSNTLVPKSVENPKGLSFTNSTEVSQPLKDDSTDNRIMNDVVQKNLSYLNDTVDVPIADSTSVKLLKEVSATDSNYSSSATAKVNPDGTIYYKLTIYNLSSERLTRASIIDVLPYKDDNYIVPSSISADGVGTYEPRNTNIPLGAGYQPVTFVKASGEADNVKFYYYNKPWESSNNPATGKIGMLYDRTNMSMWTQSGWEEAVNPASNVSAVGAQIEFGAGGLASGDNYTIKMQVKAPGYTADKIEEYNGKVLANSAALAVVRESALASNTAIGLDDRVEPNQVLATMALPTGSIGDYVWFDANNDGIQGAREDALDGVQVELWQTRHYLLGNDAQSEVRQNTVRVATTSTNQDGKYLFDNLPCDYKKQGATGTEHPFNYVGNEYYRYTVKFVLPPGFEGITDTYTGDDTEIDSNIITVNNGIGVTEPIALSVQQDKTGKLIGQRDMSIDAGLIQAYAVGDRVWFDRNENGIQDSSETGVPGVSVSLYRVNDLNGNVQEGQQPIQRMLTDAQGSYKFTGLLAGYYVVRFDVSGLRKTGGYAYQYDFTKTTKSTLATVNNNDSDAEIAVDKDGRIKDTKVIKLTEEGLQEGVGAEATTRYDPRWDAGLVVYSAISGFCYDDRDYDDVQGLMIPLGGTKVELFAVDLTGKEELVATQVVGSNGRYYFDHLSFMGESQNYKLKFTYPKGYEGVDADMGADDQLDSDVDVFERTAEQKENRNIGYISQVTVNKDSIMEHCDAGASLTASIGDYVWIDANKNGIQDATELPVSQVKVILQTRESAEKPWGHYLDTLTDKDGKYLFTGLESSEEVSTEYRVVFAFDRNTQVTITKEGQNSELDSDAQGTWLSEQGGFVTAVIKPGYGMTDLTWDAGIIRDRVSVGDYVWYDDNYDGIQQPDEKGVPNIPVVLEHNASGNVNDEASWLFYAETRTDEKGAYLFEELTPGNYRMIFQVPDGYRATRYNRGTGDQGSTVDSDAARGVGDGWFISRTFLLDKDDMTWDAGIYMPQVRTQIDRVPRTIDRIVRRVSGIGARTAARTGDEAKVIIWAAVLVAASAAGGAVIYRKSRRRKEKK